MCCNMMARIYLPCAMCLVPCRLLSDCVDGFFVCAFHVHCCLPSGSGVHSVAYHLGFLSMNEVVAVAVNFWC
jgi:hypothetical protein